ncbi:DUF7261 family protein [Haladaptatus sp. ZSTT2]|uniref:DUF7261 family protein n=1 Tax=Haladaptatus sp. ZSTT2 TaxID=3120515 RepID=UPI00300F5862
MVWKASDGGASTFQQAVATAGTDIPQRYDWDSREAAVETIRGRLSPTIETLETSRIEKGTTYEISTNQTVATSWATANCPAAQKPNIGTKRNMR